MLATLHRLNATVPANIIGEIPEVAARFGIDTPLRLAHFLAQCHHESIGFTKYVENLNFSAERLRVVFGKYFPGDMAERYARRPEAIGNRAYANRMGNGDESSGDGFRFRGRGAIQLTGRINYTAFDRIVTDDVVINPDLVATKYPLLSAAWFWNSRSLNGVADRGASDAVVTAITRYVNGGTNGLPDRLTQFRRFWSLLVDSPTPTRTEVRHMGVTKYNSADHPNVDELPPIPFEELCDEAYENSNKALSRAEFLARASEYDLKNTARGLIVGADTLAGRASNAAATWKQQEPSNVLIPNRVLWHDGTLITAADFSTPQWVEKVTTSPGTALPPS